MNLINLLVTVIILGLIFGVIWWGLQKISMPEPFKMVAIGIFVLIVVLLLVGLLTGHTNFPGLRIN